MTELSTSLLEKFIIAKDKKDILKEVTPFSNLYKFLEIMIAFHSKDPLSANLENLIKDFIKTSKNEDHKNVVEIKFLLKKIEEKQNNPAELKEVLNEINKKYLFLEFHYEGQAKEYRNDLHDDTQLKTEHALSQEQLDSLKLDTILALVYETKDITKLKSKFYHKIDLSRFNVKSDASIIVQILNVIENINDIKGLIELLVELETTPEGSVGLERTIWQKLNLSNKKLLMEKKSLIFYNTSIFPQFVEELFDLSILSDDDVSDKNKIELLEELIKFCEKLPTKYGSIRRSAIQVKIQIMEKNGSLDTNTFIEYLKDPVSNGLTFFTKQCSNKIIENRKKMAEVVLSFPSICITDDTKLVEKCLRLIFKKDGKISDFEQFFETKYLEKLFVSERLFKGEECPKAKEVFSESELQNLFAQRVLKFESLNKNRFGKNEAVELKMEIKNVVNLIVRIFEVSTLNYILENNNQNYSTIDVSGLVPSGEFVHKYSQNQMVKHIDVFKFENIQSAERGVFIIDFIAEEIKTRAVISKGRLSLIFGQLNGRTCYILDENGEVCKGKNTGVYIGNTFFEANFRTGFISIPYSVTCLNQQVPTLHNGFADLCLLNITDPNPCLDVTVVYNSEAFLAGNKVKFIVEPRLTMYDQITEATDILSNISASIITTNDKNVQNKTDFKNLKITSEEDIELELIFPNKVISINVVFFADITINKEVKTLKVEKLINIEQLKTDQIQNLFFTKNSEDEIKVLAMGRSGEPRKNQCIQIEVVSKHMTEVKDFNLVTNEKGFCFLGKIENYDKIRASCGGIDALLFQKSPIDLNYPNLINLKENDDLELPINPEFDKIRFFEINSNDSIVREFPQNELIKSDNQLCVKGLKIGNYLLKINDYNDIRVNVLNGTYIRGLCPTLMTKTDIIAVNQKQDIWFQRKIEYEDFYEFSISSAKTVKARLLTYNFLPEELHVMIQDAKRLSEQSIIQKANQNFALKQFDNIYGEQIRMNDEVIYAYDRKTKRNLMGNTLEKPGIILKRNKIGETTESEQEVNRGDPEKGYAQFRSISNKCKKMAGKMGKGRINQDELFLYQANWNETNRNVVVKHFLSQPGQIHTNLKPVDGKIKIPKNLLKNYSFSFLHLSNGSFASILPISYEEKPILAKDVTLHESKKEGYIYSFAREVKVINANEKLLIDNIDNTQICLISNIKELFDAYVTINKSSLTDYKDWEFVHCWHNLKPMEKLKKYDKFASHELNLFLFNKDKEFFNDVIRPLLENKKEKQIVDYFLLGQVEKCEKFFNICSIDDKNLLEKILLADLAKNSKPLFTKAVQNYFKSSSLLNKLPIDKQKALFETLLNINSDSALDVKPKNNETPSYAMNMTSNMMPQMVMQNYNAQPMMEQRSYMAGRECLISNAQMQNNYMQSPMQQNNMRNLRGRKMEQKEYCQGEEEDEDCYQQNCVEEYADDCPQIEPDIFVPSQGTVEYNEKQYYNGSFSSDINDFWYDLLIHLNNNSTGKPFCSSNFMRGVKTITELLIALSFTDLSFEKPKIDSNVQDNKLEITSTENLFILTKEVIEKKGELLDIEVLCSQKIYDPQDPVVYDDEDPDVFYEKSIEEYIIGKIYASRIVLTNSTTAAIKMNLISQIPQGAIPVDSYDFIQIKDLLINSFSSEIVEFKFYFPKVGTFSLFPATVVANNKIVCMAKKVPSIEVKAGKTNKVLKTMSDVLADGNIDDILEFIRSKNMLNSRVFSFDQIYHLLQNKTFFEKVTAICEEKGIFDATIWSFSIYHTDLRRFIEYINSPNIRTHLDCLKFNSGAIFQNDSFEIREYYPLINPRAHVLGNAVTNIINTKFKETYNEYLFYLFLKVDLTSDDIVLLINYLLVQDQIEKALEYTNLLTPERIASITTHIQFEYQTAYLNFITGYPDFSKAKSICEKYLTYPVLSWRNLFVEIANQLAEFEESSTFFESTEVKEGELLNKQKSTKVPSFTCNIENKQIKFVSNMIGQFTIKFYKIELEVIFSLSPFDFESKKTYTCVSPFFETTFKVHDESELTVSHFNIPECIFAENLFVEVRSSNEQLKKSEFLTYIPFLLNCVVTKEFGILKCVDPKTNKPVPKLYAKCFAKYNTGEVKFYKDGYTDLRGSFDFVSLNTDKIDNIQSFAVMVTSPEYGSKILIESPPKKIGVAEGEAKKLISKNWMNIQKEQVQIQQKKSKQMNQYQYCI